MKNNNSMSGLWQAINEMLSNGLDQLHEERAHTLACEIARRPYPQDPRSQVRRREERKSPFAA
jgi:hypothetical protein